MIFFGRSISRKRISALYVLVLLLLFSACNGKKQNRLSKASSPYLLQHADNPVDWYEWGDEAMALAKKENKPLLISIGYASCHWCHVMEDESFMDTAVARIMNDNFICIKVDREERPDIDKIYLNACQLISGNSGWPLNAFALPDGKPFFAGTYYSKQGWISLLTQIAHAYTTQYKKVKLQAYSLSNGIANLEFSVLTDTGASMMNKATYQSYFEHIYSDFDTVAGGLKGAPKFPNAPISEFLLQYYFLTKDTRALNAATTTLTNMALGGIYDQVGGGFARYATDSLWRVPHFEKMLYDNAQLISLYAHAYQLSGNVFFKNIMQETIGFIQIDMHSPAGGYYSSINSGTDEGEGVFYAWSASQLKAALAGDYSLFAGYYNVSAQGKWKPNANILYASATPTAYALQNEMQPEAFQARLAAVKQTLLQVRNKREKPSVDDKILTSWNALLIEGFLDAYAASGNQDYLRYALSAAGFLEAKMLDEDGKLWRNFKNEKRSIPAFLDDYACLAKACIRLYELTFDKHWLLVSKRITDYTLRHFKDQKSGMFYYSTDNGESALLREIDIADEAMPSSNSVMAQVLYKLGTYFEDSNYQQQSKQMLYRLSNQLNSSQTTYYTNWCQLAGLYIYGSNEVAVTGKEALKKNLELQQHYLPTSVFMGSPGEENLLLLAGKVIAGKTLIYVCTNRVCKQPVQEVSVALQQLGQRP